VAFQLNNHVLFVDGIAVQHVILRDQAARAFGEKDLVPEFDRRLHLAALDEVGLLLRIRKKHTYVKDVNPGRSFSALSVVCSFRARIIVIRTHFGPILTIIPFRHVKETDDSSYRRNRRCVRNWT